MNTFQPIIPERLSSLISPEHQAMLREKAVKKQRSASALPEISERQPGRSTQRGPDEYQEQLNQVFDNLKADKKNS